MTDSSHRNAFMKARSSVEILKSLNYWSSYPDAFRWFALNRIRIIYSLRNSLLFPLSNQTEQFTELIKKISFLFAKLDQSPLNPESSNARLCIVVVEHTRKMGLNTKLSPEDLGRGYGPTVNDVIFSLCSRCSDSGPERSSQAVERPLSQIHRLDSTGEATERPLDQTRIERRLDRQRVLLQRLHSMSRLDQWHLDSEAVGLLNTYVDKKAILQTERDQAAAELEKKISESESASTALAFAKEDLDFQVRGDVEPNVRLRRVIDQMKQESAEMEVKIRSGLAELHCNPSNV